jgi:(4S)-4-hydroxy-5-phosphonooxypentane-2,3-dione isomerase
MLAMWVKVRVKPAERERFLKAIEVDALGSERDEPGCMRFNVLQDAQDQNVYYFYEVYRDEAALQAHRAGRPTTPSGARPRTRWTARPR